MSTTQQLSDLRNQSQVKTDNPFARSAVQVSGNALAVSDHNRAIAEVQAAMIAAKQSPRDQITAMDRILNACTRPTLADSAVYQYSKGGTDISGPSIRLAEAIAQQWGNIQFGFNELTRGVDYDGVTYSEVGAYAWDLESNTRRPLQFRVRHWRDTKKGGYALKDEREIYELIANQAQRRVRACILAVIPGDVVEAAVKQCETTLKSNADTSPEAINKMVEAFSIFGVTKEQIEKRIQRRIDSILPAQVVGLKKIYASLRDGVSVPSDWFEDADRANVSDLKKSKSPTEHKGESSVSDDNPDASKNRQNVNSDNKSSPEPNPKDEPKPEQKAAPSETQRKPREQKPLDLE
ncbi:MAG: hypothetical protein H6937_07200 [Burkholderiales bacterium]|nr:hypothetical protein [Burkholderiales bacterium]